MEFWDGVIGSGLKLWDVIDSLLVMFVKFVIVVSFVVFREIFWGMGLIVDEGFVVFFFRVVIILLKEFMFRFRFIVK